VATTRIYLKGGPCDGRTVSANQIVGGLVAYIPCGGGYYVASAGKKRPNGNPIWDYSGTTAPTPPSGSGSGQPHVHKGWHDIRRSVNTNMPHALARAQHLTRHALRATSHGGKVKP
jgi:hypothetical protein